MLAGKHILIVEDEAYLAFDLKDALVAAGAVVLGPASSIDAAKDLIESHQVDSAILDVNLAGELSYPVAEMLNDRAVPFGLVTGYDGWSIDERFQAVQRLSKPFTNAEVVRLLEQLCEGTAAT